MRPVEESIEVLSRAVQSEVRAEAEQILADARAKADAIRQAAEKRAAEDRVKIMEHAAQEATRIRSQTVATTQLKARTLQLERREKLLDSAFAAAWQQLPTIQQRSDYDQVSRHLLSEALIRLGADMVRVKADEHTRSQLPDHVVADITKDLGVQFQIEILSSPGVGVVAETVDGHRRYDNTLETRLSRQQNSLRPAVFHLLMGEPP